MFNEKQNNKLHCNIQLESPVKMYYSVEAETKRSADEGNLGVSGYLQFGNRNRSVYFFCFSCSFYISIIDFCFQNQKFIFFKISIDLIININAHFEGIYEKFWTLGFRS